MLSRSPYYLILCLGDFSLFPRPQLILDNLYIRDYV